MYSSFSPLPTNTRTARIFKCRYALSRNNGCFGFISFATSTLVGTAFALILIKVINLQSFNWTVFYHFTPQPYLVTALTALAASLAAAAYPVWSVFRKYPAMQIREE